MNMLHLIRRFATAALPASLLATALTSPAAPFTAASLGGPAMSEEQVSARYDKYRDRVNELRGQGKDQSEIDVAIEREFQIRPVNRNRNAGTPEYKLVATSAGNVKLYTPSFGYDSLLRKYVMSASWEWQQCSIGGPIMPCWYNDRSSPGNMGGPDGMAIKISRPINRYDAGISTNDNCGTRQITNNQADTDNGYGVAFIEQDAVSYTGGSACLGAPVRYNWHRGTVSETFLFSGSCAGIQMQIDSKIGHTWSTTSVNSISISTSGIGFSWSSTSYKWNAIPATPAYGYC